MQQAQACHLEWWRRRCRQAWPTPRSAEQATKFSPQPTRSGRKTDMPQIATSRVRSADTRRNSRQSTSPAAFSQQRTGHGQGPVAPPARWHVTAARWHGRPLTRWARYTAGVASDPGRPVRPRSEGRRSPTRSSLAGPVVPSSTSVATSATRPRESRARLRSTSKAVTASSR